MEPGQIIQPGQGLLTLVPLKRLWITANFKETQLTGVRPARRPRSHVDMNGQALKGAWIPWPAPPARA